MCKLPRPECSQGQESYLIIAALHMVSWLCGSIDLSVKLRQGYLFACTATASAGQLQFAKSVLHDCVCAARLEGELSRIQEHVQKESISSKVSGALMHTCGILLGTFLL